ncbi:hypothetical protein [Roseovarius sp. 2305UL8-3]|uniref:hypothetical protein n=1 Tax=Roseovarius conchicola TaxID=3121636 RepID=UPI0035298474
MPFDQQGYATEAELHITTAEEQASWPYYLVAALIMAGWATSVALFGIPGLYIPAVLAVPVIFATLVRITLG